MENPCGTADSPPCENWDRDRFHILSDGQLVVGLIDHAALDHEESRSLVTVVRITDSGGLFSESTVEIQIEDENEGPMFNAKIQEVIYVVAQSTPESERKRNCTIRHTLSRKIRYNKWKLAGLSQSLHLER